MQAAKTILVFDTESSSRSAVEKLLGENGYRVIATGDPQEAALHAEAGIDLAFVELAWCSLDGLEVALRAKAEPQGFVPVIVLVEDQSALAATDGYIRGVDGVVCRPVDAALLLPQVTHLIQARSNHRRLAESYKKGPLLSVRDRLPGLYNRRFLTERLRLEIERAENNRVPLTVMVMDVDDFKEVNQTLGYNQGDRILAGMTSFLRSKVRSIDTVCRFGGEEFVAIFPGVDGVRAAVTANRMREELAEHNFEVEGSTGDSPTAIRLTASFGVAAAERPIEDGSELLRLADDAVWLAKRQGKNCVVLGAR